MKKNLNVFERLMALKLLPKEGDFITLKVVKDLQESLGFSEKEIKDFELKNEDGKIQWNAKAQEGKDMEFGETAISIFAKALKKLDEDKKLTFQHMSLYDKFVEKIK